ncbi:MAG: alpha/beta hydrolase [Planctomyces sp.]|nr:alpha/beta hydrolase [Planctomyces sp.]
MYQLAKPTTWIATLVLVFTAALNSGAVSSFGADQPIEQQPKIVLWPEGAPEAKGTSPADVPYLSVYPADPARSTKAAIVVCPGGGYGGLAKSHEGHEIGQWLNSLGISAYVLTYRHAPAYKDPVPRLDVQRAIRLVRAQADEAKLDANKIGVLGFSAGGHLASTAATQFDAGTPEAKDPIDRLSSRPDFAILCYPVITMEQGVTHGGSRKNLLGDAPDEEDVKRMSSELRVTPQTPPTFLWHTEEDTAVLPENSQRFYAAMLKHGVPGELHVFQKGRHGIGLGKNQGTASAWPTLCAEWLKTQGVVAK